MLALAVTQWYARFKHMHTLAGSLIRFLRTAKALAAQLGVDLGLADDSDQHIAALGLCAIGGNRTIHLADAAVEELGTPLCGLLKLRIHIQPENIGEHLLALGWLLARELISAALA